MSQHVIDGILYSPVCAHSLRRGDLINIDGEPKRATINPTHLTIRDEPYVTLYVINVDGRGEWIPMESNRPVLRAVGAGVGGLL